MTKVYLVWQGSYSDASVVGVFSTEEAADKLAAMDFLDTHVEEFEIDAMKDFAERGLSVYQAWSRVGPSIEVSSVYKRSLLCQPDERELSVKLAMAGTQMAVNVMARDEEHAIKIAADKFREFKAVQP